MLVSINPTTGEELNRYEEMSDAELDAALTAAADAFQEWRRASFGDRGAVMRRAAAELRSRKATLARLMAVEMGKPLSQGQGEVEKCAIACEYFAEHAPRLLADEEIESDASR